MRFVAILLGIALAAAGGVIAYRAAFLESRATVLITEGDPHIRQLPDLLRLSGGIALLIAGAVIAFICARRTSR